MPEHFEPFEFLDHVRRNVRIPLGITSFALLSAIIISLVLPSRYTATASILIEPPGASDPRVSTAVSPMYLESLKTYEQFAGSDSLFARACDTFHLLQGSGSYPIESFKKRVLEVKKLKDTKLLQISVTLPDPKRAQAVVQYLAEQTVTLSNQVAEEYDREALNRARSEFDAAAKELQQARARMTPEAGSAITVLEGEVGSLADLRSSIASAVVDADVGAAEGAARALSHFDMARAASLKVKDAAIASELKEKSERLAKLKASQADAEARVRSAEAIYDQWSRHVAEIEATVGTRGEQLRIIDPGIVPQKPSSPNLVLNCVAALASSIVLAMAILCVTFALRKHPAAQHRPALQVARRGSA